MKIITFRCEKRTKHISALCVKDCRFPSCYIRWYVYLPRGFKCLKPAKKLDSVSKDLCEILHPSPAYMCHFKSHCTQKIFLHEFTHPMRKRQPWLSLKYDGKVLYFILLMLCSIKRQIWRFIFDCAKMYYCCLPFLETVLKSSSVLNLLLRRGNLGLSCACFAECE
jgi:hypothetical protein